MKFTVNLEASDEELKKFAADTLVQAAMGGIGELFNDPQYASAIQGAFAGIAQTIQQSIGRGPPRGWRPPMTHGPQAYPPGYVPPYPPGYAPPAAYPPGVMPYGPAGPYAASQPSNVHPIREPAAVEKCFPIEATRYAEAGICCCRCATYNGVQRTSCRHCGHQFCHVIAPPPPAPEPAAP
jgi:hypothetical protein